MSRHQPWSRTLSTLVSSRILPRSRVLTVALVVAFAALTAVLAQVRIPLFFTPVPITGQTFAVLLAGLALGTRAGAASQALYVAAGAVGLPVFQGGQGGWSYVTGPTLGYLVGFIAAAAIVGRLRTRQPGLLFGIPAALAGTAIIYIFGVAWLAYALGIGLGHALALGLFPFLIGDALKALLAGLVPVPRL
ncbi:MAG: biotin transporter BioY [Actinobacteria bacterium]|nr:biotin transporter BioY [Actinomycetota bacterium]